MKCLRSYSLCALLLAFCLLVLPSVASAQCPNGNCPSVTVHFHQPGVTVGRVVAAPFVASARVVEGVAVAGAHVVAAPFVVTERIAYHPTTTVRYSSSGGCGCNGSNHVHLHFRAGLFGRFR